MSKGFAPDWLNKETLILPLLVKCRYFSAEIAAGLVYLFEVLGASGWYCSQLLIAGGSGHFSMLACYILECPEGRP